MATYFKGETNHIGQNLNNTWSDLITNESFIEAVSSVIPPAPPELLGTSYVFVYANGTDTENAAELQSAYDTAKTMSPSPTNRITIIASPGYYNFGSTAFTMEVEYIDLVSLDGNRSIIFNSANAAGTIAVTGNDIYVKGVDVGTKPFTVASHQSLLKVENCKGGDYSFGFKSNDDITVNGTFIDCAGGNYSFGVSQNGTPTRVVTVSGVFTNCIAGDFSFAYAGAGTAQASGTFTNCKSGTDSFGIDWFYGFGVASGVFRNCIAGDYSFGSYSGTASGTFYECEGGDETFGTGGTCSGVFYSCVGGNKSFGNNNGLTGSLTGKIYWCKKTAGTFQTVSGLGQTRMCLDGTNVENNQG